MPSKMAVVLRVADVIDTAVTGVALASGAGTIPAAIKIAIKGFIKNRLKKRAIKKSGKWVISKTAQADVTRAAKKKLAQSPGGSRINYAKRKTPKRESQVQRTRVKQATRTENKVQAGRKAIRQRNAARKPSTAGKAVRPIVNRRAARSAMVTGRSRATPFGTNPRRSANFQANRARNVAQRDTVDAVRAEKAGAAQLQQARSEGAAEALRKRSAEVKKMTDAGLDPAAANVAADVSKVSSDAAAKEVTSLFGKRAAEFAKGRPILGFPIKHPFATAAITTVAGSMIGKGESPEDTALQHQMLLQSMLGGEGGEGGTVDKDMIRAMRMMRLAKMMETSDERVDSIGGGRVPTLL